MMNKRYQLAKSVSARLVKVLVAWGLIASIILTVFVIFVNWVPVLIVTLGCGVLGGFISLQRRLKTLSIKDLELLDESWYYTLLSPLTGGFLAVVLYMIFISGLLAGDLFPAFTLDPTDTATPGTVVFRDIIQVRANTVQDYAKLLVWSFIAGYSEKFVINIIGQFRNTALERGVDEEAIEIQREQPRRTPTKP
ncbi:MAG TPA: hypothetical protein VF006_34090 [Longimicrobium sp.]